jgi:hypothetical protein
MSDLNALKKRLQIGTATNQTGFSPFKSVSSNWINIVYKVLIVLIILLTVAIFIHFTIKPIFRFASSPDALIPLPFGIGGVKGELYWNSEDPFIINEGSDQKLMRPTAYNYTMVMDIVIVDPNISVSSTASDLSGNDRLIFCRTNTSSITRFDKSNTTAYNLAIYMESFTNDLIVSTTTSNGTNYFVNSIVIPNIPYGKPFRLAVVLSEYYMEVYINNKLYKTKTLQGQPNSSIGYYIPSPHTNIFKLKNFQVWSRVLTPKEIRAVEPELSGFDKIDILRSVSQQCGRGDDDVLQDDILNVSKLGGIDIITKLTGDTGY